MFVGVSNVAVIGVYLSYAWTCMEVSQVILILCVIWPMRSSEMLYALLTPPLRLITACGHSLHPESVL